MTDSDCTCMELLCAMSLKGNQEHAGFIKEMMFLLEHKSGNLCFLNCRDLTLGLKTLRIRLFIFSTRLTVLRNKKTQTNNDRRTVSVLQLCATVLSLLQYLNTMCGCQICILSMQGKC